MLGFFESSKQKIIQIIYRSFLNLIGITHNYNDKLKIKKLGILVII